MMHKHDFAATIDESWVDSAVSAFNNMTYDITNKQRTKWRKNKKGNRKNKAGKNDINHNKDSTDRFIQFEMNANLMHNKPINNNKIMIKNKAIKKMIMMIMKLLMMMRMKINMKMTIIITMQINTKYYHFKVKRLNHQMAAIKFTYIIYSR